MSKFLKILPIILLPILDFFTEIVFRNYLLTIVAKPNDIHFITIVVFISYSIGLGVGGLSFTTKREKSS